ncbi:MAG: hypothetical protein PHF00_03970 [Elusimicrobia bacterium]|nr:hypothetical protein [Elusimicrobiota bacterium]
MLTLALACPGAAPSWGQAAATASAARATGGWGAFSRGSASVSLPAFASFLGIESELKADPALFGRIMGRTALAPEVLEGKSPQAQARLIREAVGAYAAGLCAEIDGFIADEASGRLSEVEDGLDHYFGDIGRMPGLVPDDLRPRIVLYKEKAADFYARQLREDVERADREWRKGEEPAPTAGEGFLLSRPLQRSRYAVLGRRSDPIARNPRFQDWLRTSGSPYAALAGKLAGNLTWAQADFIDQAGGISRFPGKQGCEHCCLGCIVKAGDRRPIRQMSWEDFTDSVRALVGLQAALTQLYGRPYALIHKEGVTPFYDSEPMSVLFPTRDGPPKTIADMVRFLHETAGVTSVIWSAGWNPRSVHAQGAAKQIVSDILADRAPYLDVPVDDKYVPRFGLQFKPVVKRFRDEARAFVMRRLGADAGFQGEFGEEFRAFGFDFNRYPSGKGEPAKKAYRQFVEKNREEFFAASAYMSDLLDNIKTILPAIRKDGRRVIMGSYYVRLDRDFHRRESDPEMLFLDPWMDSEGAIAATRFLQARLAATPGVGALPDAEPGFEAIPRTSWSLMEWRFGNLGGIPESKELGAPIALFNGTIGFAGVEHPYGFQWGIPNSAVWPDAAVRGLSDNPVLALSEPRPLWSVAADRLDGTRHLNVSKQVRQSIAGRVAEVSGGAIAPHWAQVEGRAILRASPGKRREAWVRISAMQGDFLFRFADGYLYDLGDLPRRAEPR